ncbi:hypothetical protein CHCC20335_4014 [Bacillus paralicheniformis]|nr:hypothetical protein CHCC20335_4014 [Bacillus paralicheniformis]
MMFAKTEMSILNSQLFRKEWEELCELKERYRQTALKKE